MITRRCGGASPSWTSSETRVRRRWPGCGTPWPRVWANRPGADQLAAMRTAALVSSQLLGLAWAKAYESGPFGAKIQNTGWR